MPPGYSSYAPTVPEVAIIPVKSFRMGKQRLSTALPADERERLGQALAGHVAETVEATGLIPLVVTADADVASWAMSAGFPSLPDSGDGLDAAAAAGVAWAEHTDSAWIVFHADLPLLGTDDVAAVSGVLREGSSVIAPSSDGGTSAIGGRGHFEFSFGVGSFHRHLARLTCPTVIIRTGLLLDVDSPDDLSAVRSVAPERV
jgi:2-phospho-L-lactate guanylyltransferase